MDVANNPPAGAYGVNTLKVDQACLKLPNKAIFISNINIPDQYLDSPELPNVVQRIQQFIASDYIGVPNVQFQVCASYKLVHTTSGATRHFHGSFMPGGNQSNVLLTFRPVTETFRDEILEVCQRQIVQFTLLHYNVDTNWVFDSLTSIIISVQALMPLSHTTLFNRGFVGRSGHGFRRNATKLRRHQTTFPLP